MNNQNNTQPTPVEEPCKRCGQEPYPEATRECIKRGTGECELARRETPPAERPTPDVKTMGAVTICRNGYVEDLERQLAESREQRDRLASAIRSFSTDFEEIRWGWDGDCGSDRLAERLLNEMTETMKGSTNESR